MDCPKCGCRNSWYTKIRVSGTRRINYYFKDGKLIDNERLDDDLVESEEKSLYCFLCDHRVKIKEEWI